ncbi:MAG TPA: thioredoxin fold domain-containing protein [Bacteroidota bacterium]|nr:thioredoxin fold domain-containing protein [Bacteroidota bacterium]
MKKTTSMIFMALAFLASSGTAGELIHFRDTTTSWDNVLIIAAQQNKLVFVDAYTDWCVWCKVMDKETFSDSAVAKFMDEKFVPVKYEMETGFGLVMSEKYRVNGFPSFLIFTTDGKLVYRILGYLKPKEFLEALNAALDPSKQEHLTGVSASLEPGFPQFYKDSFLKGSLRKRPDSATVNSFLASSPELASEVAWSVLFRFSSQVNDNYRGFVYDNFEMLKRMYGANDVQSTVGTFLSSDLNRAIKADDEPALRRIMAAAEKYSIGPIAQINLNYQLRFYSGTNRWTRYADLIDSAKRSGNALDENAMNSYSWTVYLKCDNKDVVARAAKWMGAAVETRPEYMLLDTYAALLYKNGELKKAKEYAERAIANGKQGKEDVQETEELLKKINASLEAKP